MRHLMLLLALACAHGCDDVEALTSAYVCMDDNCPCDKGVYCGSKCVNLKTSADACGACGTKCGAGAMCANGQCVCPLTKTLCGGACSDVNVDPMNCGGCGKPCATGPGATVACVKGQCKLTCAMGQADCDNLASNGCETTLATDEANCGLCGHACGGAGCAGGVCNPTVLQAGLAGLSAMTTDGNGTLYYSTATDVRRVATAGGAAATLVVGENKPSALQISGQDLAWITPTSIQTVNLTRLNGGVSTQVLAVNAVDIAMNGTVVFFAAANGAVSSVDVNTKAVATLVGSGGATRLTVDGTAVYYAGTDAIYAVAQVNPMNPRKVVAGTAIGGLAVDSTTLYFTTDESAMHGTIGKVDTSGTNSMTLLTGRDKPTRIVASNGQIYFLETDANQVVRLTNNGATVLPIAVGSGSGSLDFLAVDAMGVYYSVHDANGSYAIYKARR